jgi:adenylate kinase
MGALPIVLRTQSGALEVKGLAKGRASSLTDDALQDLLKARQAMAVDYQFDRALQAHNVVAMWIGNRFLASSHDLRVSAPLPSDISMKLDAGQIWIGQALEVHARLLSWLEKAFRRVIESSSTELTKLMVQALPDHELTRAAIWRTANDQQRQLDWFARLDRDRGYATDPKALRTKFVQLCNHPPLRGVRAIMVTGVAGSGHRQVAEELVKQLRPGQTVTMVSFGKFLREQFIREHERPPSQPDLQAVGQELVQWRPFAFTRDVLAAKPATAKFVIVDGVRHHVIRDAIQYLFDGRASQIGVIAPEPLVVRRLADREGSNRVREIQDHPTEREIPDLLLQSIPVHYDTSERLNRDEVQEASQLAIA